MKFLKMCILLSLFIAQSSWAGYKFFSSATSLTINPVAEYTSNPESGAIGAKLSLNMNEDKYFVASEYMFRGSHPVGLDLGYRAYKFENKIIKGAYLVAGIRKECSKDKNNFLKIGTKIDFKYFGVFAGALYNSTDNSSLLIQIQI